MESQTKLVAELTLLEIRSHLLPILHCKLTGFSFNLVPFLSKIAHRAFFHEISTFTSRLASFNEFFPSSWSDYWFFYDFKPSFLLKSSKSWIGFNKFKFSNWNSKFKPKYTSMDSGAISSSWFSPFLAY